MKKSLLIVATAALATMSTTVSASPALGAGATPEAVNMVTMVSATTTSLTFTWKASSGATAYEIESATDSAMSNRRQVRTTTSTSATVSNLDPGQVYCFQVRAVNQYERAARSRKSCQRPISTQGTYANTDYRLMTYNICAVKCSGWTSRRAVVAQSIVRSGAEVVALQETSGTASQEVASLTGLKVAYYKSGKALLYADDRFTIAVKNGQRRAGDITIGSDSRVGGKGRYAVWAELADRSGSGKRAIFSSTHLSPGKKALSDDERREAETEALLNGISRLNVDGLPVVLAGDFNSHQGRRYNSPQRVLESAGMGSAFFNAERWTNPNLNTGHTLNLTPKVGTIWGYHIDQIWVDPERAVINSWSNAEELNAGAYVGPLGSDHSPVLIELSLS